LAYRCLSFNHLLFNPINGAIKIKCKLADMVRLDFVPEVRSWSGYIVMTLQNELEVAFLENSEGMLIKHV
jgi:hypothetical protein